MCVLHVLYIYTHVLYMYIHNFVTEPMNIIFFRTDFLPPTVMGDRVVVEGDGLSLICRSLNSPSNPPVEWLSPDGSQIGQGGSLMDSCHPEEPGWDLCLPYHTF